MAKRKRETAIEKPVTSAEQWEIIEYYTKHGAPKVKAVAKRLLKQRGAASVGGGSTR